MFECVLELLDNHPNLEISIRHSKRFASVMIELCDLKSGYKTERVFDHSLPYFGALEALVIAELRNLEKGLYGQPAIEVFEDLVIAELRNLEKGLYGQPALESN